MPTRGKSHSKMKPYPDEASTSRYNTQQYARRGAPHPMGASHCTRQCRRGSTPSTFAAHSPANTKGSACHVHHNSRTAATNHASQADQSDHTCRVCHNRGPIQKASIHTPHIDTSPVHHRHPQLRPFCVPDGTPSDRQNYLKLQMANEQSGNSRSLANGV